MCDTLQTNSLPAKSLQNTPELCLNLRQVSNTSRAELRQITVDVAAPRLSIASDEDTWGGVRRWRKTNHSYERCECQSRVLGGRDSSHPSCTTSRHVMHTVIPFSERNIYFPVCQIGRSRRKVDNDELTTARWLLSSVSLSLPPAPPKEDAWNAAFIQLLQVWDVHLAGRLTPL